MAYWYVKGTTGATGNAGTSWTAAKQSVAQVLALAGFASGDIVLVDRNGTFTATAANTWVPRDATILQYCNYLRAAVWYDRIYPDRGGDRDGGVVFRQVQHLSGSTAAMASIYVSGA